MRVAIINNGKGAQELARLIPNSTIFSTSDIKKMLKEKFSAYILTDGAASEKNRDADVELMDSAKKPVLAIGFGYLCLGALMGADVVECKPVNRNVIIAIKHGSPLTMGLKKVDVKQEFNMKLENIPEDVLTVAPTPTADIIQDVERPIIGVNFLPEKSKDGPMILKNFLKFSEVYDQYHK